MLSFFRIINNLIYLGISYSLKLLYLYLYFISNFNQWFIMVNIFVLLTAITFLFSFMAFFWALILRYNAKKMLIEQRGEPPEEALDFKEMKKLDPGLARTYSVAIKLWSGSIVLLVVFGVAAYLLR